MAKILIVDDEKQMCNLLSKMLFRVGHEIVIAFNGYEAFILFSKISFDLVITDLDMPIMNGWTLSKLIKQKSPATPVIMITGNIAVAETTADENDNVDLMMRKPFNLIALKEAVAILL